MEKNTKAAADAIASAGKAVGTGGGCLLALLAVELLLLMLWAIVETCKALAGAVTG